MKLTGDEKGIGLLKQYHEKNNDYLKFLLQEARTNFGNSAVFKGEDGESFRLHYEPATGEFKVEKL